MGEGNSIVADRKNEQVAEPNLLSWPYNRHLDNT